MSDIFAYTEITPREIQWVIDGRVPRGELTVLAGVQGLGKSMLTTRWAADLSRQGRTTLLVSTEDSPSHTIWWRLTAAQADKANVFGPRAYPMFDGNGSAPIFEEQLDRIDPPADLIVLDPFTSMIDVKSSSWNDQHMRLLLAPLVEIASRRDCAVVLILHLNKSSAEETLHRVGGSTGLTAGPRSVLLFGPDKTDPEGSRSLKRLLVHEKCNVAERAATQAWRIAPILVEHEGRQVKTARLDYEGETEDDAGALFAHRPDAEERSKVEQAEVMIRDMLVFGDLPSRDLDNAADAMGISRRTLESARANLGVIARKKGRQWHVELSQSKTADGKTAEGGLRSSSPHGYEEEGRNTAISGYCGLPSESVSQSPLEQGSFDWIGTASWDELRDNLDK